MHMFLPFTYLVNDSLDVLNEDITQIKKLVESLSQEEIQFYIVKQISNPIMINIMWNFFNNQKSQKLNKN